MTKVGVSEILVDVERNERVIKILETPTLLNRLYKNDEIDIDEYTDKLQIYKEAIENKNNLLKNELKEGEATTELKLRDYQQKIVDYAKEFKSFAIFDEPRLGKTPTTIELLKAKGLIDKKIIVICPGKVVGNWIKRFEEWSNKKALKYEGNNFKDEVNIYVMSYQRTRLSLNEILKWGPEVAILDEAHVLRNSKGNRQKLSTKQKEIKDEKGLVPINKSILKIGKKANHRYVLSGTPSVNSPEDIFAILQFEMPNMFNSYWTFCYYFFRVERNFMGGREIKGYQSIEKQQELQEILDYCSSNNKQKESMTWLNPPKKTYIELELNQEQKILEENLIKNGRIKEKFILNVLEQMTHYNSIVLNPKIIDKTSKTNGVKTEFVLDFIMDNFDQNIAIFSTREEALRHLKTSIQNEFPSLTIYEITGSTKNEKSIEIQDIINKKSKKSGIILLGTIGTCKEGITLEGLNKAISLDQSWVPSDMEQLMHRLDATTKEAQEFFGQKEFVILNVPETIDDIVEEALKLKKSTTEIINDYKKFIEKRKLNE